MYISQPEVGTSVNQRSVHQSTKGGYISQLEWVHHQLKMGTSDSGEGIRVYISQLEMGIGEREYGCTSVNRIWVHLSRRESRWLFGIQYCALPAFPRSRCEKVNYICLCRKGSPACAGKGHMTMPEGVICMCRKGLPACARKGHMTVPEGVICMCRKGLHACAEKGLLSVPKRAGSRGAPAL